jgi:hypothetical protein
MIFLPDVNIWITLSPKWHVRVVNKDVRYRFVIDMGERG